MSSSEFPPGLLELEEHHPAGKDFLLKRNSPYLGELAFWLNSRNSAVLFSEEEISAIIFRNVSAITIRDACDILRRIVGKKR